VEAPRGPGIRITCVLERAAAAAVTAPEARRERLRATARQRPVVDPGVAGAQLVRHRLGLESVRHVILLLGGFPVLSRHPAAVAMKRAGS